MFVLNMSLSTLAKYTVVGVWVGLLWVWFSPPPVVCSQYRRLDQSCTKPVSIPVYEALHSLYTDTQGSNWTWASESSTNGYIWNFTAVTSPKDGASRPCSQNWQGLLCSPDPQQPTLCLVLEISLASYNLMGQLPLSIGNLTDLDVLDLTGNRLSGTLPYTLGSMDIITTLFLDENRLIGSIPTELGRCRLMSELQLQSNSLTGTIPTELFALTDMQLVIFSYNHLYGSVSSLVGNWKFIEKLDMSSNSFTGRLPSELGALNQTLQELTVDENAFSGPIPTAICALTSLTLLNFGGNVFTDQLPTEIGLMTKLIGIDTDINLISGPIPSEIGKLSHLLYLEMSENCLSGSIPTELGLLFELINLSLGNNRLTGFLPAEIGNLVNVILCYFNVNYLTGSLPSAIGSLRHMHDFIIATNLITSSLPQAVVNMSLMQEFSVTENYLTGSLEVSFTEHISVLQVDYNYFSGNLDYLFPPSAAKSFPALLSLAFADNGLTGSFPSSLFELPLLKSLFASSNCFSGSLQCGDENNATHAKDIAAQSSIVTMDLNGLSSGITCRNYIIERSLLPSSGYFPSNYMDGSIPSCFWNMKNLTSLYLEGNGFTGPIIPADNLDLTQVYSLNNLSLASNELTGTIPTFIWNHKNFLLLDLSSNRFRGGIPGSVDICSDTVSIDISVNRLSGDIDNTRECSWSSLSSNFLEGNMFTFAYEFLTPEEKEEASTFYGSDTVNIAMIIAAPIFVVALALIGVIYSQFVDRLTKYSTWMAQLATWNGHWQMVLLPVQWIHYFNRSLSFARYLVVWVVISLTSFVLLVSLLKFAAVESYGTYVNQYSWSVSTAYMHGLVPVMLIASALLCILVAFAGLVVCFCYDHQHLQVEDDQPVEGNITNIDTTVLSSTEKLEKEILFRANQQITGKVAGQNHSDLGYIFVVTVKVVVLFVINLGIIGLTNAAYLIAVLNNNPQIQFIQVALSVFKLIWNTLLITNSLRWLGKNSWMNPLLFRYTVKLFNFVVVPILATSLVADTCFLKLFQQQPAPTIYEVRCTGANTFINGTFSCIDGEYVNDLADVIFKPPFMYSFQCSSALIANYVPVLLYSCVLSGLVIPGCLLVFMLATDDASNSRTESGASAGYVSRVLDLCCVRLFDSWLPQVLRQSTVNMDRLSHVNGDVADAEDNAMNPIFPIEALMATQLLNVTLFGTFGLAFPYLGAIIICGAVFEIWTWLIAIGKYHCSMQSTRVPYVSGGVHTGVEQANNLGLARGSVGRASMSAKSGMRLSSLMMYDATSPKSPTRADATRDTLTDLRSSGSNKLSLVDDESLLSDASSPGCVYSQPGQRDILLEQRTASYDVLVTIQSVRYLRLRDLSILIVIVLVFWSGFFFDMIADVYGTNAGITTVFVVIFCGPIVAVAGVSGVRMVYIHKRNSTRRGDDVEGERLDRESLNGRRSRRPQIQRRQQPSQFQGRPSADERFSINSAVENPLAFNSDFTEKLML
jgi:Leucine-rich repeat (LRR) protein